MGFSGNLWIVVKYVKPLLYMMWNARNAGLRNAEQMRVCSAKSGLLSSYDGYLGKLNYAWQENKDASGCEPGSQASLICWNSYIGIAINFHEESGIVTS